METNSRVSLVLDILNRGGIHSSKEIGEELDLKPLEISSTIRNIRKNSISKGKLPYVFTTPHGYTLDPKPSDVIYESNMRLKFSVGVIMGGIPCFNKAKKIASYQLTKLKATYKPSLIRIGNII